MASKEKKSADLFLNRELSWLEFNNRVLSEGASEDQPLGERLKFLSIVSSNLDEFFMIRVAGLKQQKAAGVHKRDPSGLTPSQQLFAICSEVRQMVTRQNAAIADVCDRLTTHGFHLVRRDDWTAGQRLLMKKFFAREVSPVLTPLAVEQLDPCPLLPGLQLYVAVSVAASDDDSVDRKLVAIPVPSILPRLVNIPSDEGVYVTPIEEVVLDNVKTLLGGHSVTQEAVFRLTRDADVAIQEEEAADLLSTVEDAVLARRRRLAVRLEISVQPRSQQIKKWLMDAHKLRDEDVFEIDGLIDARALMQLTEIPPIRGLMAPEWPPQAPRDLIGAESLWQALQDRDVLLMHPFEQFEPVVRMVEEAADDPNVLAIKQTLYRTSGKAPIVRALARAAENGKAVTVLVELKARFDETRNVDWARQLEDAGCHVIYGIAGYKTHAKALLVIRRDPTRIRRYVHLATGNYNERTAQLYCDIGMMTCDDELASDVANFFNLLTGLSEASEWRQLVIAPTELRRRFLDLIEREIQVSTPDRPGLIMAKMNALEDQDICRALYEASQAGVEVLLNVRGICCLRPGVKKVSETIHVRSIVDRYLEHARVFYFANGGHEEVYLSSADWMRRNLSRRLELLFPVRAPKLRRRLVGALQSYFKDNVQAWELQSNGRYCRVEKKGPAVRVQQRLYEDAVAAVRSAERRAHRFRPLTRPD